MSPEEQLETLLAVHEPAEIAAQDADLFMVFMQDRNVIFENQVRARMRAITIERGLGPNDLDDVWAILRLEKGDPQPFPGL